MLKQVNGQYYKIGKTVDPSDRLKTFAVKLPFDVEYDHLIPSNNPRALESELHAMYASKRVAGEWFALDEADVIAIKQIEGM